MNAVGKFGQGLENKIAVYIPSTFGVNNPASSETIAFWIEATHRLLASAFGGATSQVALGSWIAKDGSLVTENVTIVYTYADTLSNQHLDIVFEFAVALRTAMKQEVIAIEINNRLHFV